MTVSAIVAENVWWVCVVAWFFLRLPHQIRSWKEPIRRSQRDWSEWTVLTFMVATNGVIPFIYVIAKVPRFANYPFVDAFAWIGTAVFLVALWLFYRTHKDLGRNWSMSLEIRSEHSLVTEGVYRHIRHPMYLAFLLWGVAQTFLLPNWIAGPAGLVGSFTLYLFRRKREESMMLEEFGDQYRAYMRRTARIVPWIH